MNWGDFLLGIPAGVMLTVLVLIGAVLWDEHGDVKPSTQYGGQATVNAYKAAFLSQDKQLRQMKEDIEALKDRVYELED